MAAGLSTGEALWKLPFGKAGPMELRLFRVFMVHELPPGEAGGLKPPPDRAPNGSDAGELFLGYQPVIKPGLLGSLSRLTGSGSWKLVRLSSVLRVRAGHDSPVFARCKEKGMALPAEAVCWTAAAGERSLDVACADAGQARAWVEGLGGFVTAAKAWRSAREGGGRGRAEAPPALVATLPAPTAPAPKAVAVVKAPKPSISAGREKAEASAPGASKGPAAVPFAPFTPFAPMAIAPPAPAPAPAPAPEGGEGAWDEADRQAYWAYAILQAVRGGRNTDLALAFSEGADPATCVDTHTGDNALTLSARIGYPSLVRTCLEAGVPFAPTGHHGSNALEEAIASGHEGCARELLAVAACSPEDAEYVLCYADANGNVPLALACARGYVALAVAILQAAGGRANLMAAMLASRNSQGRTALHSACAGAGGPSRGAEARSTYPGAEGSCEVDYDGCVQALLSCGVDAMFAWGDVDGRTPLHLAAGCGALAVSSTLLGTLANPLLASAVTGRTALDEAAPGSEVAALLSDFASTERRKGEVSEQWGACHALYRVAAEGAAETGGGGGEGYRSRSSTAESVASLPSCASLTDVLDSIDREEWERGSGGAAGAEGGAGPTSSALLYLHPWMQGLDPTSGWPYWYNVETQESSWEAPIDLMDLLTRLTKGGSGGGGGGGRPASPPSSSGAREREDEPAPAPAPAPVLASPAPVTVPRSSATPKREPPPAPGSPAALMAASSTTSQPPIGGAAPGGRPSREALAGAAARRAALSAIAAGGAADVISAVAPPQATADVAPVVAPAVPAATVEPVRVAAAPAPAPAPAAATPGVPSSLTKFAKLVRMGVPLEPTLHKMRLEGMEAAVVEAFAECVRAHAKAGGAVGTLPIEGEVAAAPRVEEVAAPPVDAPPADPRLEKYARMRKMGVPLGAVRGKMAQDGLSMSDIEALASALSGGGGSAAPPVIKPPAGPSAPAPAPRPLPPTGDTASAAQAASRRRLNLSQPGGRVNGPTMKLHWDPLQLDEEAYAKSMWGRLGTGGEEKEGAEAPAGPPALHSDDVAMLTSLFAAQKSGAASKAGGAATKGGAAPTEGGEAAPGGPPAALITLLDLKKTTNLNIGLAQFRRITAVGGYPSLVRAVYELDEARLPRPALEALGALMPTPDDTAAVRAWTGDPAALMEADRFYTTLLAVPRFGAKVAAATARAGHEGAVAELRARATHLALACRQVEASTHLRSLLGCVLSIGNILNEGVAGLQASAIRLDSLLKLGATKSSLDKKTSLMDALVLLAERRGGDALVGWAADLPAVIPSTSVATPAAAAAAPPPPVASALDAGRLELSDFKAELGRLKLAITAAGREAEAEDKDASAASGAPAAAGARTHPCSPEQRTAFAAAIRTFSSGAASAAGKAEEDVGGAESAARELAAYFGEDAKSTPPSAVFAVLRRFAADFVTSVRTLQKKRAAEARTAAVAAGEGTKEAPGRAASRGRAAGR